MLRKHAGFTLVELMIVMTLLAIMALSVTAVFQSSLSSARADHAARDFYAEIKAAQERAVDEAAEIRVYFDPKHSEYWTAHAATDSEGKTEFAPTEGLGGRAVRAADRLRISNYKARQGEFEGTYYLAFYPSGACDPGSLKLTDVRNPRRTYLIETTGTRALMTLPRETP